MPRRTTLAIHPLTPDRWGDLEALFGKNGAYSNCWCTYWLLKRSDFDAASGVKKRALLRSVVDEGAEPGLLAYEEGAPVGWVALQPRAAYASLLRSPMLRAAPGAREHDGIWSITCFFVRKDRRRTGVMRALLDGAADHARRHGAHTLEGYPTLPPQEGRTRLTGSSGYMGLVPAFERAGFREAGRPSATRRIMRRALA